MWLVLLRRFISLVCFYGMLAGDIIGNYRICALRVSFAEDDAASTTGNGQFLQQSSGIDCGGYTIDPPPHDQSYFQSQLKAVDAYFRSVSYDNFGIDLENSVIYPDGVQASYELEQQMNYYHPYGQDDIQEERLTRLFQDALITAYENGNIDYSEYDLVVVFHAGIGQDFSLPFLDPTPEDIPSTFIDRKMIFEHLGTNSIQLGNGVITNGILLPETQNHLLYDIADEMFSESLEPCEYQYGLTGTFALMLGFAIGLPPLWNIETGESGVGIFGLMDQGSNNGRGLIPAPPTAWSRSYAGWEAPIQAEFSSVITLLSRRRGQVVELPIHGSESFLVENRTNDVHDGVSLDSMRYNMWKASGEDRYPPLVETLFDSVEIQKDENGVVTFIPDYDLGLPASGLLIWHIDRSVINSGLDGYTVNSNINRLGVDLEEADGAQDIGHPSFFLFADPSGGYFGDMWFQGNEEYNRSNPDMQGQKLEFGPSTFPNTSANDGAASYITIGNIGESGDTMTITVTNSMMMPGYPDSSAFLRSVFDLDDDGVSELIGGSDSLWFAHADQADERQYFLIIESNDVFIGYLVREDHTLIEIVEYGSDFTRLWHYKYLFEADTVMLTSFETLDSAVYTVYFDPADQPSVYSASEWINHTRKVFFPASYHYGISLSNVGISVTDFNGTVTQWTDHRFQYLAGIDLNLDATLDLLALEENGALYAFNSDLNLMPGFPLEVKLKTPVLARDLMGDQHPEIVGKEAVSNSILVFDHQGNIIYRIASSHNDQLIAVSTLQGQNAILTRSAIYTFGAAIETKGNEWSFEHGNWGRNRTVSLDYTGNFTNDTILHRAYCYPNPIRENAGKIRVESLNAEQIKVILYDLAGYFVTDFNIDNLRPGLQVSEWEWEVSEIESGMYFAHVSAIDNTNISTDIIKIAVIH